MPPHAGCSRKSARCTWSQSLAEHSILCSTTTQTQPLHAHSPQTLSPHYAHTQSQPSAAVSQYASLHVSSHTLASWRGTSLWFLTTHPLIAARSDHATVALRLRQQQITNPAAERFLDHLAAVNRLNFLPFSATMYSASSSLFMGGPFA